MKKMFLLVMIIAIAGVAGAKDVTKEAYLASKKIDAEKAGTAFNETGVMGWFNEVDTNKDGIMSDAEQAAYKEKKAAAAAAAGKK